MSEDTRENYGYSQNDVKMMTEHFIIAGLWTGHYQVDEDSEPEPLDDYADESDLTDAQREWCEEQCAAFVESADEAGLLVPYLEKYTFAQMGHDFLLTADRHGAGFWDRGLGELGDKLTELTRGYSFGFSGWKDRETGKLMISIDGE